MLINADKNIPRLLLDSPPISTVQLVVEQIIQSVPEQIQCLAGRVNSHGECMLDQAEICYVAGMLLLIRTARLNSHTRLRS